LCGGLLCGSFFFILDGGGGRGGVSISHKTFS